MPGWLVVSVLFAAGSAVVSFLWWSAGRARLDRLDPDRRSAGERFEIDVNRIRTMRNRDY